MKKAWKFIYPILFIGTIFFANWMIYNVGICGEQPPCVIPVWFNTFAPSGVLSIGIGFTLRDLVQRHFGVKWTIACIILGALLSGYVSPNIAIASGLAFFFSEMLDLVVYTPLKKKNLILAVFASNIVGLFADSSIFLLLAFGSLTFLFGQVIGKFWVTLLFLPVIKVIHKWELNSIVE